MDYFFADDFDEITNYYRTNEYIVQQRITFRCNEAKEYIIISNDTYILRSSKADAEYERIFKLRKNIEGRRIPTMMYTRKYIY